MCCFRHVPAHLQILAHCLRDHVVELFVHLALPTSCFKPKKSVFYFLICPLLDTNDYGVGFNCINCIIPRNTHYTDI